MQYYPVLLSPWMYSELVCRHTCIAKQLHNVYLQFYQKSTDIVLSGHKIKAENTTEYAAMLKDDYEVNNIKYL